MRSRHRPGWRNRQTRRTQNPLSERACGFESRSGHCDPATTRLPVRVVPAPVAGGSDCAHVPVPIGSPRVTSDVVIEDWLWDEDSPEEPEEYELSYEERLLRKRAMRMFFGSILGVLVLAALGVVAFRVMGDDPVRELPAACTAGRVSECPERPGAPTRPRSDLPGGFDPRTGESDADPSDSGLTRKEAEARIAKCLRGQVEFCG
jgi:hypothetical protein